MTGPRALRDSPDEQGYRLAAGLEGRVGSGRSAWLLEAAFENTNMYASKFEAGKILHHTFTLLGGWKF